jgi:predicted metalloprotease with PDZ domain
MRSLDSGAVENEDDQQQTKAAFQFRAVVLDRLRYHRLMCSESRESQGLYTNYSIKSPTAIGWLFIFLLILLSANTVSAQSNLSAYVEISISSPGQIRVEAQLSRPINSWSFRNAYAGVLGIAERIQDFRAVDADVQKAAVGEYRSERKSSKISYTVKVPEPTLADVSHFTWLTKDRGILMLADLIPLEIHSLSAQIAVPPVWWLYTALPHNVDEVYEVSEPEKAVFCVGRDVRWSSTTVEGMPLDVMLTGKWSFKERDAMESATSVMRRYLALTGFRLPQRSAIVIAPLPIKDRKTGWKAETRGSTVMLLINPEAEVRRWKPQLTVIFAHEILHLWVPNSLKLEGDYDWFFEGFTLYTALRTSLELGVIDFKEYLATLGRVYDTYRAHPDTLSLIDESERRWASDGSQVYVKGMLVAFLYDLLMRKESGGQRTLADSYRELFSRQLTDGADGNEAIISLLGSTDVFRYFIKAYVENSTAVDLNKVLPVYGLSVLFTSKGSQLRVGDLNEDQKQLLRSLGYR